MGTELFKHYTAEKAPFLKCGYNNMWSVYKGEHRERKLPVCIFVIDKKQLKKDQKNSKSVLDDIRKVSSALSKYKHPNILGLVEQVKEDQNWIGFITERFNYSLASWLEFQNPTKLEIKNLMIDICKSLSFLHNDAHVIHNNLCLDTIFITESNQIKIGFLDFAINDPNENGNNFTPNSAIQNLSYVAPEIIFDSKSYYSSDIYSLGLIIYNMLKYYKKDNNRILIALITNSVEAYKDYFNKIDSILLKLNFDIEDNDLLRQCLVRNPETRQNLDTFMECQWFNDPKLKALNFIERLEENETNKSKEFLRRFPKLISLFEEKIIVKRFLPALIRNLKNESLMVDCLPSIFDIAERKELNINFERDIWPSIKQLLSMKSLSAACLIYLLQKTKLISSKISNNEFASHFLKIICKGLDCNVAKLQSCVIDNLSTITKKVDSMNFKNQIYPRIINVLTTTNSHVLKIEVLKGIKGFYNILDQKLINDNLLNNLEKVRKMDNSTDICMLVTEVYEEIAKVVNIDSIANKILPMLISILVSGNISKGNFESIMKLVRTYLDRIKADREKDLFDDKDINGSSVRGDNSGSSNVNNNSTGGGMMNMSGGDVKRTSDVNIGGDLGGGNSDDFLNSFFAKSGSSNAHANIEVNQNKNAGMNNFNSNYNSSSNNSNSNSNNNSNQIKFDFNTSGNITKSNSMAGSTTNNLGNISHNVNNVNTASSSKTIDLNAFTLDLGTSNNYKKSDSMTNNNLNNSPFDFNSNANTMNSNNNNSNPFNFSSQKRNSNPSIKVGDYNNNMNSNMNAPFSFNNMPSSNNNNKVTLDSLLDNLPSNDDNTKSNNDDMGGFNFNVNTGSNNTNNNQNNVIQEKPNDVTNKMNNNYDFSDLLGGTSSKKPSTSATSFSFNSNSNMGTSQSNTYSNPSMSLSTNTNNNFSSQNTSNMNNNNQSSNNDMFDFSVSNQTPSTTAQSNNNNLNNMNFDFNVNKNKVSTNNEKKIKPLNFSMGGNNAKKVNPSNDFDFSGFSKVEVPSTSSNNNNFGMNFDTGFKSAETVSSNSNSNNNNFGMNFDSGFKSAETVSSNNQTSNNPFDFFVTNNNGNNNNQNSANQVSNNPFDF